MGLGIELPRLKYGHYPTRRKWTCPYSLFYWNVLVCGAKDPDAVIEAKGRLLSDLDEVGLEVSDHSFEQKAAVFMEDFELEVNLEALAVLLGLEKTVYEPEQFPGLVYRPEEYGVTLLVFASGKVIIGGTTNRSLAEEAVNEL